MIDSRTKLRVSAEGERMALIGELAWFLPLGAFSVATTLVAAGEVDFAMLAAAFTIGWSQLPGL